MYIKKLLPFRLPEIDSCLIAGNQVAWKIKDSILYHNFSDVIITNDSQTAALKMATFEWTKVNVDEIIITLYEERPCLLSV